MAKDVSRGPWKKSGTLHSVIRVSYQAATSRVRVDVREPRSDVGPVPKLGCDPQKEDRPEVAERSKGLCLLFIHPPAHGSEVSPAARNTLDSARIPRASKLLICGLFQKVRVLAQDGVWEQTFGATPPRSLSRVFLLRVLLHEHQCRTYGGHSVANRRVLAAMANGTPGLAARTGSVSAGRPETNQVRCARMNK